MSELLFDGVDCQKFAWQVEEFFNSIYSQDRFLWALPNLVSGISCVVNDDYCRFPDSQDPDPEMHFDGVLFGIGDDEIIIGRDVYEKFFRDACKRYISLHPEHKENVMICIGGAI